MILKRANKADHSALMFLELRRRASAFSVRTGVAREGTDILCSRLVGASRQQSDSLDRGVSMIKLSTSLTLKSSMSLQELWRSGFDENDTGKFHYRFS